MGWSIRYSDMGDVQGVVHTLAPLPSGTPIPPFVPGVDLTENDLVFGYARERAAQLNHAQQRSPDAWKATFTLGTL